MKCLDNIGDQEKTKKIASSIETAATELKTASPAATRGLWLEAAAALEIAQKSVENAFWKARAARRNQRREEIA
jgi:hypothetical protein